MRSLLLSLFFLWVPPAAALAPTPQEVEQNLAAHIQFSQTEPNEVGYLYIGGHNTQIGQGTWVYVKKALDFYKENPPRFLILKLDTPGGEVFAAQKISDALKELDTQHDIPVVAVIDNWAISAGAMLAYSCRFIAVAKDGAMGAAEPITQSGEKTSEKINSAIRTDFANRAAFFDRNPLIAEAMVDADLVLVVRDGKIVSLRTDDQIEESDRIITTKGKLLTLKSSEMIELGVAEIPLTPTKLAPINEAEEELGRWPGSKELLFSAPFFKSIPNVEIVSYQMDWRTRFFSFLASPIVTSVLFLGLMIFGYLELNTPGFGVAGSLALVCLFFLVLASFALEAASWLEFLLLGAGIGLILIEIFVIPGFGFIGILGIVLALAGLAGILLPGIREVSFDFDTGTLNAAGEYFTKRLAYFAATLLIGLGVIALFARFFAPKIRLFSPLVLRGEQEGYVAGLAKESLPPAGSEGTVVAPLRPAGKVEINGERFDAVSSGGFIGKGERVVIVSIQGSKIVVEEVR